MKLFPKMSDKPTPALNVMIRLGWLFSISLTIIVLFMYSFPLRSMIYVLSNGLMVIGASGICGFLVGFLFGIPRSIRFRFNKTTGKGESDTYFADNTNLEEISDWATKILIGLSLVEIRKILALLNTTASNVAASFPALDKMDQLFVFSYSMLVYFFGLGGFTGYFWARTLFGSILAHSRQEQEEIIQLLNRNLSNVPIGTSASTETTETLSFTPQSLATLQDQVEKLLETQPIQIKDDTQKNRWGGKSVEKNRILRANVVPTAGHENLYDVTIEVRTTSTEFPLTKTVVILLDSSFPEPVIYLTPINNIARVTVVSYEAFTVGALCDELSVELELDLQKVPNYPKGFYY